MKYSFVIPTYNKKHLLKRTLQALDQLDGYNRDDYEAIIIDDGSSEDVFDYIKGVNSRYPLNYVYLDRGPNSCRARSRNYGIDIARGKYIAFIDDDIVVNSDYLKQLERYYQYSDNLVIIGTRVNCSISVLDEYPPPQIKQMAFSKEHAAAMLEERHLTFNSLSYNLASQLYPWVMTVTCNLSVPRDLLLRAGGFDENFDKWGYEDLEIGYRLFKSGAVFVVNPNMLAFHQEHPASAPGANNYDYFIQCCNDVFEEIDPVTLLSLFSLNSNRFSSLKKYRRYQGPINENKKIMFDDESKVDQVKQEILESSRVSGCEVTVHDSVECTDLDIWIQLLELQESLVLYHPQSMNVSRRSAAALLNNLVSQSAARVE